MKTEQLKKIILYFCIVFFSYTANADWILNSNESSINFVSVKKSKIAEIHTFKEISGSIDKAGGVEVTIALDSVETLIPIRNERMRKLLFETVNFPSADVSANIDTQALNDLTIGDSITQDISIKLSLHGKKIATKAQLKAVMLKGDRLSVITTKPVILNMGDYDLIEGVEALRKAAKLPSISTAVPATVNLIFTKSGS